MVRIRNATVSTFPVPCKPLQYLSGGSAHFMPVPVRYCRRLVRSNRRESLVSDPVARTLSAEKDVTHAVGDDER